MGEIVVKKMVYPTFNRIITTANKYNQDATKGGLIDPSKTTNRYMDIQTVVAVGPMAKSVEVGDTVSLTFERYKRREYKNSLKQDDPSLQHMDKADVYDVPVRIIDGKEYFLLGDNDIEFIIPEEGWEEKEDSVLYKPEPLIV